MAANVQFYNGNLKFAAVVQQFCLNFMSDTEKISSRKGKTGSIYSIIGVSLVLLIMGIMGSIFLILHQLGDSFKEEIRISAYLNTANKDTITQIQTYLKGQPFAKDVTYIDKAAAKKIWNEDSNEDWDNILDYNPLPESIDFYAKADYVNKDSLAGISQKLKTAFGDKLQEITYPQVLVNSMNEKSTKLGFVFLVVAVVLSVIVIVSIDNTIKLIMYSNRFLIKTMQMVGATRWFIAKPLDMRAIVNGIISAVISIAILLGLMKWSVSQFPQMRILINDKFSIVLFAGMVIIGVLISLLSTHRSVMKYLRTRLDDLY
ncbi:cell division protein FtsX [Rhizosphaericola mali]|uniref:Cell division protein FtsX n=1 Tax=Rhizosphaericola mali TaxID=2545455 RepID=A0A5P2FZ75_9BACT|nr:permease-like cell division protein FtsX [Rhizosphaericola mali]QES87698.1 FtsX-like permease family protein [Rhizosphaericola mali]